MTTATEAKTEPVPAGSGALDTGPQAVLALAEQEIPQRTIARMLNISQATVTRRIKEAIEARRAQRRAILINAMLAYLTLLATVVTVALAWGTWG
jgi:DNA-binding Lrp family transcriptional regulator